MLSNYPIESAELGIFIAKDSGLKRKISTNGLKQKCLLLPLDSESKFFCIPLCNYKK